MTPEQYEQWKDFSFRFAKTHFAKRKDPSLDQILKDLDLFFHDNNDPSAIDNWMDIVDYVSGLFEDVWQITSVYCNARQKRLLDGYWDYAMRTDDFESYDEFKEQIADQWESPATICIRAGIDLVSNELGVVGYTAGDILALYPEGVPIWLAMRWPVPLESVDSNTLVAL